MTGQLPVTARAEAWPTKVAVEALVWPRAAARIACCVCAVAMELRAAFEELLPRLLLSGRIWICAGAGGLGRCTGRGRGARALPPGRGGMGRAHAWTADATPDGTGTYPLDRATARFCASTRAPTRG